MNVIKPDLNKSVDLPDHPYSFKLDPFQQHAICAIARDENVLICAKTGSGKTLVGEYQIYHSLKKGKRVFYTTPIKSLSNQKFYDLKHQFTNEATIGIMTGDIKFCPDAQIVIMTTEILRNLLYKKGTATEHLGLTSSLSLDNVDAIIFDECHYINDKDRGKIWEETMILLPPINMVMLSATLDHPEYLANWLGTLKQKPIHLIETDYRVVPLTHNLVTSDYKLVTLMDEKENYHEKVYTNWINHQQKEYYENLAHQKKVSDVKAGGHKGGVEGKVHSSSFAYRVNETIKMLEKQELLPAIFFILSRKQCESYAKKIESTLITSADAAAVKHIISFHLRKEFDKVPQYHQL